MNIDSQVLYALQLKHKMNQKGFAKILGMTEGNYSSILIGRINNISNETRDKLSDLAIQNPDWDAKNLTQQELEKAKQYLRKENTQSDGITEELKATNEYLKKQYEDAIEMLKKAHDSIERLSITNSNLVDRLGKYKGLSSKAGLKGRIIYFGGENAFPLEAA